MCLVLPAKAGTYTTVAYGNLLVAGPYGFPPARERRDIEKALRNGGASFQVSTTAGLLNPAVIAGLGNGIVRLWPDVVVSPRTKTAQNQDLRLSSGRSGNSDQIRPSVGPSCPEMPKTPKLPTRRFGV